MFGLALGTTAVWVLFDAAWFARRESAGVSRLGQAFQPEALHGRHRLRLRRPAPGMSSARGRRSANGNVPLAVARR